jgi:hypothetical protein
VQAREIAFTDHDHHIFPVGSKAFFYRQLCRFRITGIHSHDGFLKTRDDFTSTDGKLQRFAIERCIEYRPVVQFAAVMNPDGIPVCCLSHDFPPFKFILKIEFPHFSHRFPHNGLDFFVQSGGESGIKAIELGKINFPAHFVA